MLNEILPHLQARLVIWAEQLRDDSWINQSDFEHLISLDTRSPSALFNLEERPLVVGLFGGTGVGKSSLLNRLAKENIARTGVERPTSREVTVYIHQSVSVANLPEEFPTDKVKVALHKNEQNQDLMWIDMPDFDSAEQSNKKMVLEWLPFIDVLIYVVNPERYKDDTGWRLLLQYGLSHAWLFVMNHWDRGDEAQRGDFIKLLQKAGLNDPVLFCTDSSPGRGDVRDDFSSLESTIQNLASDNIIRHLEQRGINLQIQNLQARTQNVLDKIGETGAIDEIANDWYEIWRLASDDISESLQWKMSVLADRYTSRETRWYASVFQAIRNGTRSDSDKKKVEPIAANELWDEQIKTIASDALEQLIQDTRLRPISIGPLKNNLKPLRKEHERLFSRHLHRNLQYAVKSPGSKWRRILHKILAYLTTLLPLAAMSWVAYSVIVGFYLGTTDGQEYLGFDFAIHSGLLIGLAWLVPYFLSQKLKPSLRDAVFLAMQESVDATLQDFNLSVLEKIESLRKCQRLAIEGSEEIFSENLLPERLSLQNREKIISRMLMQVSEN